MTTSQHLLWQTAKGELSALATVALSLPMRWLDRSESFDPDAPHPTPVVFVHGFLGDPTNFRVLRNFLAARGVRNFASFSYPPPLDPEGLAPRLGRFLEAVCQATGAAHVDVVAHSLGGLVARYLIETGGGQRVHRLVTLGSPHSTDYRPARELAIFAAEDPIVRPPDPAYGPHGRILVVPRCGHVGLLYHRSVLLEVAHYLTRRAKVVAPCGQLPARKAA